MQTPKINLADKRFKYVHSYNTDIKGTFGRAMIQRRAEALLKVPCLSWNGEKQYG